MRHASSLPIECIEPVVARWRDAEGAVSADWCAELAVRHGVHAHCIVRMLDNFRTLLAAGSRHVLVTAGHLEIARTADSAKPHQVQSIGVDLAAVRTPWTPSEKQILFADSDWFMWEARTFDAGIRWAREPVDPFAGAWCPTGTEIGLCHRRGTPHLPIAAALAAYFCESRTAISAVSLGLALGAITSDHPHIKDAADNADDNADTKTAERHEFDPSMRRSLFSSAARPCYPMLMALVQFLALHFRREPDRPASISVFGFDVAEGKLVRDTIAVRPPTAIKLVVGSAIPRFMFEYCDVETVHRVISTRSCANCAQQNRELSRCVGCLDSADPAIRSAAPCYCNAVCQEAQWPLHRPSCGRTLRKTAARAARRTAQQPHAP